MPNPALGEEKKFYQTARFWRWAFFVSYVFLSLYAFRQELSVLWNSFKDLILQQEELAVIIEHPEIEVIGINFLVFLVLFFGGLLVVSQFVLPVQTIGERTKAANRMLRYLFRKHGPAVFIKDGQINGRVEEIESPYPGVAFVDLCSAIALENQNVKAPTDRAPDAESSSKPRFLRRGLFSRLRRRQIASRPKSVRVAGPGLVFTEKGEKLRGVADMRRQFRAVPNVSFATREGFSVNSHIFIIFSLGDNPDVLKVALQGDKASDIRTVQVDEWTKKITGFKDELDEADKVEIFKFMETYRPDTLEEIMPEVPRVPATSPPYVYDSDRIFAAVYSDSQDTSKESVEPWHTLPPRVAIDVLRDMLSLMKFNDLYRPEEPYVAGQAHTFPFLDRFRPEFVQRMRNQGVLGFQAGLRRNGRLLQVGDRWDIDTIEILPQRRLRNSKVLRDRGIRVLASGFPELNPKDPGVRQQLVEYWSARWKQEAERTEAEHYLQAIREQTKARAEAQRNMVETMRRIFSAQDLGQAAMIVRLFQALELAAGDPRTRQLVPEDSLNFLWDLRSYLLPEPRKDEL